MKEQIRQWLASDREFSAGAALYNAHGSNDTLKKLFSHGEYSFSRTKLEVALEELLGVNDMNVVRKISENVPEISKNVTKVSENVAKVDLREQMRPLLDDRTMLHNQLTMYEELQLSQEDLKKIAFRIKDLSRQIDPLYRHLQAGTTPEPDAQEDYSTMNFAALFKTRQNLKCLRSKVKKNPDRQEELPEIEAKIKQLTELIEK